MTQFQKDYYLRRYQEWLLHYSLGKEYLPLFEYKDGKIITEKAWVATYDYIDFDGMMNINHHNGYPLCREDIKDLISYLKDLVKKAPTRSQMTNRIMHYYEEKIKEIENTETKEEEKVYKRTAEKHYIYFSKIGKTPLFKVGFSKNPEARVKQLQLLTADSLALTAIIPIEIGIRPEIFEKKVHQYLEEQGLKVRSEIFRLNDDQLIDVLEKFKGEML